MTKEEKIIHNLKRRKFRIVSNVLLILFLLGILIFLFNIDKKLEAKLSEENIKLLYAECEVEERLPKLIHYSSNISSLNVKLTVQAYLIAIGLGLSIGRLIIDLSGSSKDRLLISMWEKIKYLEDKNKNQDI